MDLSELEPGMVVSVRAIVQGIEHEGKGVRVHVLGVRPKYTTQNVYCSPDDVIAVLTEEKQPEKPQIEVGQKVRDIKGVEWETISVKAGDDGREVFALWNSADGWAFDYPENLELVD